MLISHQVHSKKKDLYNNKKHSEVDIDSSSSQKNYRQGYRKEKNCQKYKKIESLKGTPETSRCWYPRQ